MNIFKFEMRALLKSSLGWALTLSCLSFLFLNLYPIYAANTDTIKQLFAGFPPIVLSALGINLDSFFSISGFYSFVFTYIVLIGAIQAMQYGLGVMSKETRMKTADFLMTKPVKRSVIIWAKLWAVILNLIFTNVIYIAISSLAISQLAKSDYSVVTITLQFLSLFLVQMIFVSLGAFYGIFAKRVKSVLSVSLTTVFGFYALSMLGAIIGDDKIRYLSPFKYFDAEYIILHEAYEPKFLWITFAWIAIGLGLGYFHFLRKEIHIG